MKICLIISVKPLNFTMQNFVQTLDFEVVCYRIIFATLLGTTLTCSAYVFPCKFSEEYPVLPDTGSIIKCALDNTSFTVHNFHHFQFHWILKFDGLYCMCHTHPETLKYLFEKIRPVWKNAESIINRNYSGLYFIYDLVVLGTNIVKIFNLCNMLIFECK